MKVSQENRPSSNIVLLVNGVADNSNTSVNVGNVIASGRGGVIFEDKTDNTKLIKRIDLENDGDLPVAEKECELFVSFYGPGSAFIVVEDKACFIRMKKIPGETLDKIKHFPVTAEHRFRELLQKMESKGIFHNDLKPDNILYDARENVFYAVDFGNYRELLLDAPPVEYKSIMDEYNGRCAAIIGMIRSKELTK